MRKTMRTWRVLAAAPVVLAGVLLVGCGQSDEADSAAPAPAAPAAQQPASSNLTIPQSMQAFKDDGNVLALEIEGNDLMKYNKEHLEAKPGQMVRLTIKHVGQLPAQSMGHNVVILNKGEDPFEFSADANEKGGNLSNAYVPEPVRGRVVAFTSVVGGGQTAVVEFKAPQEAGDHPILCSFPGHSGMMHGVFTIK
jgi:azurin